MQDCTFYLESVSEKYLADAAPQIDKPCECVLLIKRHLAAGRFRPEPAAAGEE
jgi:hypothetical protein